MARATFNDGAGGGGGDDDPSDGSDTTPTRTTSTTSSTPTRSRDQLDRLRDEIDEQDDKAQDTTDDTDTSSNDKQEQSAGRDSGVARSDPRPNKDDFEPESQTTRNKRRAVTELKDTERTRPDPADTTPTREKGPQRGTDRDEPGGITIDDPGQEFDTTLRRGGSLLGSGVATATDEVTQTVNENVDFIRTPEGDVKFIVGDETDATRDLRERGTELTFEEATREQFTTPDREITDSLTKGRDTGFLTDEEEQEWLDRAETIQEEYGMGDETEAITRDLTGSDTAANLAGGIGDAPANLLAAVDEGIVLADLGAETAANVGATAEEHGTDETWDAIGESFGAAGVAVAEEARDNPARFLGEVIGELGIGSIAFKGIEKAGDASRAARLSRQRTVDLEDITTERGAQGDLPKFDTDPDAPTSEAVDEVSDRAADNPDVVTEGTGGDSTLYHGTDTKFDRSFDVGEGASELPGLFTSPEASPIALQGLGKSSSLSSFKPRLPRPGGKSDRFLGLPGDDVRAMDAGATGFGYELRDAATGEQVIGGLGRGKAKDLAEGIDEVDVAPDQTTRGYEFLTEQADPGAAFVRPRGSRSTELEAIFPPGSAFEKTGTVGVRVGRRTIPGTDRTIPFSGRTVPLDLFRRAGDDVADTTDVSDPLEELQAGDAATAGRLSSDIRRLSTPEGSPAAGGALAGIGVGSVGGSTRGGGDASRDLVSDVDLVDESPLDAGITELIASRTDFPRGSTADPTTPPTGTTDTDPTPPTSPPITSTGGTPTDSNPPSGTPTSPTGSPTGGGPTETDPTPTTPTVPPTGPPTTPTRPTGSSTGIGSPTGGGGGSPTGGPGGGPDPIPGTPPGRVTPRQDSRKPEEEEDPWWLDDEQFGTGISDIEDLTDDGFDVDADFDL